MSKLKISLVSTGIKIVSLSLLLFVLSLLIVFLIFFDQIPFIAFIILLLSVIFILLGVYISFHHSIIFDIKKEQIIINKFKTKIVNLQDINKISVSTTNSINKSKYCFIIFELENNIKYTISGFMGLKSKRSVSITQIKVNQLIEAISKLKNRSMI